MNKILKFIKKPEVLWLLIIITIASLFRFWQISQVFHYTLDEEYWSYVAHNVATGYRFPLIGGPIGGTGIYLGPVFVWITGVVFWLIQSNPFVLAYLMAFLGVVVAGLIFCLLKSIYGMPVAGLAGVFYAGSGLMTIYDKKFWNVSPIPLLAVLSLWLAEKLKRQPKMIYLVGLGVAASIAVQAHMSGLVLVIFGLISLWTNKLPHKFWMLYLAIVVVAHAPVGVFELRHGFVNTRALGELISAEESGGVSPRLGEVVRLPLATVSRMLFLPAKDIANELTLCSQLESARSLPPTIYWVFAALILLYSFYHLVRFRSEPAKLIATNLGLVAGYMLISPANFYPGQLSEYYLLAGMVALIILIAQLSYLSFQKLPILVGSIWFMYLIANFHVVSQLTHSQPLIAKYDVVTQIIEQLNGENFYLDVVGQPCQIYGYRFLFTYLKTEPSDDYLGTNFRWLYQRRLPPGQASVKVTVNTDNHSYILEPYQF